MRKALLGILMAATAGMPVAAQAQDVDRTEGRSERQAARAERSAEHYREQGERNQARSEQRQERQEVRQERQEVRVQRSEPAAPVQVRQQAEGWSGRRGGDGQQQAQSWGGRRGGDGQEAQSWGGRRGGDGQEAQSWGGRGGTEGQRGERWGGGRTDSNREAYRREVEATRAANRQSIDESIGGNYARQGLRNQQRTEQQLRRDYDIGRRDGRRDGDWNRDGRRDGNWSGNRDHRRSGWSSSWRNDSRYDWQRYRYSNRNLFRSGGYYAPNRNYRYNRLSIGVVLDSLFYSNRYWLSDPWQYRLPPAPYGTQWVRYYDDVVLVDVYTGEVIDVIENFFW